MTIISIFIRYCRVRNPSIGRHDYPFKTLLRHVYNPSPKTSKTALSSPGAKTWTRSPLRSYTSSGHVTKHLLKGCLCTVHIKLFWSHRGTFGKLFNVEVICVMIDASGWWSWPFLHDAETLLVWLGHSWNKMSLNLHVFRVSILWNC